jgi:hypothetical protein
MPIPGWVEESSWVAILNRSLQGGTSVTFVLLGRHGGRQLAALMPIKYRWT